MVEMANNFNLGMDKYDIEEILEVVPEGLSDEEVIRTGTEMQS